MAPSAKLLGAVQEATDRAVEALFSRLKGRILGPRYAGLAGPKKIVFSLEDSLPGLFGAASAEERSAPNMDTLKRLLGIAEGYIDSQLGRTKSQVAKTVVAFLENAWAKGVDMDTETVLTGALSDVWRVTADNMKRIVDTEATQMRAMGALQGQIEANAAVGVEDPVMFMVCCRDAYLCSECKRLHLLEDGITPRVWKLSELSHNYHKKGDDVPSLGGEHPHCRCAPATLLPGFGFDSAGMVTFTKEGHDEFKKQRG